MTTAAGDGIGHNNNNKRSGATAMAEAAAGNAGPRQTKRPSVCATGVRYWSAAAARRGCHADELRGGGTGTRALLIGSVGNSNYCHLSHQPLLWREAALAPLGVTQGSGAAASASGVTRIRQATKRMDANYRRHDRRRRRLVLFRKRSQSVGRCRFGRARLWRLTCAASQSVCSSAAASPVPR